MVLAPAAVVALGVLLALICLIGLQYSYAYSLGALVRALATAIGSIRLPSFLGHGRVLGFAADALTAVDDYIRHSIGRGISDTQAVWNASVYYLGYAFRTLGEEIASVTHDTAQAIEGIHVGNAKTVYKGPSKWWKSKVIALAAAVAVLAEKLSHHAVTVINKTYPVTKVIERVVTKPTTNTITKTIVRVETHDHTVTLPAPVTIPKYLPRIRTLEHDVTDIYRRIREIARRAAVPVAIGALIAALARMGINWIRCAKVMRTGKRVCGMNEDLLESLLADTLLIVGTISLVEFAEGMIDGMDTFAPQVRRFWGVKAAKP